VCGIDSTQMIRRELSPSVWLLCTLQLIRQYAEHFGLRVFVEAGTWLGTRVPCGCSTSGPNWLDEHVRTGPKRHPSWATPSLWLPRLFAPPGETPESVAGGFDRVYTIESDEALFAQARHRHLPHESCGPHAVLRTWRQRRRGGLVARCTHRSVGDAPTYRWH
jgi:hypothetical protein